MDDCYLIHPYVRNRNDRPGVFTRVVIGVFNDIYREQTWKLPVVTILSSVYFGWHPGRIKGFAALSKKFCTVYLRKSDVSPGFGGTGRGESSKGEATADWEMDEMACTSSFQRRFVSRIVHRGSRFSTAISRKIDLLRSQNEMSTMHYMPTATKT